MQLTIQWDHFGQIAWVDDTEGHTHLLEASPDQSDNLQRYPSFGQNNRGIAWREPPEPKSQLCLQWFCHQYEKTDNHVLDRLKQRLLA